MRKEPQFLSQQEVTDFKKDSCIFCLSQFDTKTERKVIKVEHGSEYYSHYDNVLVVHYNTTSPDIYSFDFRFDDETKEELKQKEQEIINALQARKREEAERLRKELESELSLPQEQKRIAIDAIINKFLDDIKRPRTFFSEQPSLLEERVFNLFHNLQLGDLQLVWDTSRYCGKQTEEERKEHGFVACVHHHYSPVGLKSHKNCWPFKHFYGDVSFDIKYGELFSCIKTNPRFDGYSSLFKDFQELWHFISEQPISIRATAHNLRGGFI